MSENHGEHNNFLQTFIEGEHYLQNPPIEAKEFVGYSQKLGIQTTIKELEYFEKEKLLFPIFRIKTPNSCYGFSENYKDLLLEWVNTAHLYDSSRTGSQAQDTIAFYSNFQIYWLEILKNSFLLKLNLAGETIDVSADAVRIDGRGGYGSFDLKTIDDLPAELKEISGKVVFDEYFDLTKKKQKLLENYREFNKFLKFLLLVQSSYFPYSKSGAGRITVRGDAKKWHLTKSSFKLEPILNTCDLKIDDIAKWYKQLSDKALSVLGIKRDDWAQFWKNVAYDEKDALEGNIRCGIEYFHWALMLKRIMEDYCQREILDIDEMTNIADEDVLLFDAPKMDQTGILLRATRNNRYSDEKNNLYHNRYKRLFYLANDFGLNYQPKVMVFFEGKTEENIFPYIFEKYAGIASEDFGIEFFNIRGISKFFGSGIPVNISDKSSQKKIISNLNYLISYNLNKWQMFPFFVGDAENNIGHLLDTGVTLSFNRKPYPLPNEWRHIWGASNQPFPGKDFEMANFTDNELAICLSEVLKKQITPDQVKEKRDAGQGIKQIDSLVGDTNKITIVKKLYQDLFESYEQKREIGLLDRPIFKLIDRLGSLAEQNHPPVDRKIELENRKYIETVLQASLPKSKE